MEPMDAPLVAIRLLGPVSVTVDGRDVVIGSPKQRIILAMLALSGRASAHALAEELWRETPPASVAATVHTLVSRLRRTLETAGGQLAIRAEAGSYVMDLDQCQLDVSRFQAEAAAGRSALAEGAPERATRSFRDALAMWRGPALLDLADRDFARIAAVRLDAARLDVVEDLAGAELTAGRPGAALDAVVPLITEHPFRERLRGQQMVALYRLGRQTEALAAYQELRRVLTEELGLEPSPALQALELQVLQQSPELDGPAVTPTTTLSPGAASVAAPSAEPLSGGTLAFLFTDIEASTRRWEGDRKAMAADLARHDALLREVVAEHHGSLFTHTGDGMGAAFATAANALDASVEAQRQLADVAWRGSPPLRVRMAIHAGTAEARAGTFLGPTLNRTARLLDQASGGQIICSQAAADLVRDDLPPDVVLLDFGERRLEGLSRPERIWQVRHPWLVEMPSLASPPARPPTKAMLSSFVGREAELSELAALLPETRLLTITGAGGAGKTRLALELTARVEKHFVDGARVVELASVRDDRPLAHDVLSSLGIESGPSSGPAAMELLCQVLAPRQMLLVLDNCEHVLPEAAVLAEAVLRRCPRVTTLATSREVLSLSGETAWIAPGLSLPPSNAASSGDLDGSDAVELFIMRCRAVQPGFGATAANSGAIARICRSLDGIPLALELAAARVRVLSAAQLADRLDDRLRLLTSGPRSAPARQQTLRAAMDWSFELLTKGEQQLLRLLSVFPQSFDLEAATAVADDGLDAIDVLDLLARLVDKSLLGAEGMAETARYRLLETVRQYAREKLVHASEEDEARSRHRRHFMDRILAAYRSRASFFGIEWARQLIHDSENYNSALTTAVADGDLEAATVLIAGRGYTWFWGTRVPTIMDAIDPDTLMCAEVSLLVQGLLSLAGARVIAGGWSKGAAIYERALAIADESGTPEDQGLARYYLGYVARSQGDSVTARSWMEGALQCFGDSVTIGRFYAQYDLGWIDLTEGNAAAARHQFHSTLTSLLEASSDYELQVLHLRAGLALAEAIEGNVDSGLGLAHQAVEAARVTALPGLLVMALVRSAEVAAVAGKPIGPELPEVLRLLRDQGTLRWVCAALNLAAVSQEHRPEVAARLLGGATGVARLSGEDPLPLPAVASVVSACRRRLESVLSPAALADAETAGERLPVARLLELALDGLET